MWKCNCAGHACDKVTPLHASPAQLAYICERFFTVSTGQLTSYMFTYHTAVKYDVARVRLTYHIQRQSRMQELFATFMQQGGLVGKAALAVMAYYKVHTNKRFHIMAALFEDRLFAEYGCSSFSPRVIARVVSRECFHNPVLHECACGTKSEVAGMPCRCASSTVPN